MFDPPYEELPPNLETMEPGHVLAVFLAHIDVDRCSPYDRIRVLRAQQRLLSWVAAQKYRTMASIVDVIDPEDMSADCVEDGAALEVAAALRLTRRASESEMGFALDLKRRLPRVWGALVAGDIDVPRARVIVNETTHLTIAEARTAVDHIIDKAGQYTTGQIGQRLRKLCMEAHPDDAKDRYETAVEQRYVATQAEPDGTCNLFAINLPPDRVQRGMDRINRIARSLRRDGETRTMDQLRADVFLDIIEGTGEAPRAARGGLHLHSDLASLAELANHAGELAGYGPVISDIARQVAQQLQDAPWDCTVEDPITGMPVCEGTTRRRPTTDQRRKATARNRTCIFPGCRMPAINSDIDHRIPYSECRQTRTKDLAPLCEYHHTNRHRHGWTYQPSNNGDHTFTSPLGHRYTTSGRDP
jgi:hypothetical protein